MSRWRLRAVIHLPGPFVLVRGKGLPRRHGHPTCNSVGRPSIGAGFIALFLLGWLGAWRLRTRKNRQTPRVVPAFHIYIVLCTVIIVIVALIV